MSLLPRIAQRRKRGEMLLRTIKNRAVFNPSAGIELQSGNYVGILPEIKLGIDKSPCCSGIEQVYLDSEENANITELPQQSQRSQVAQRRRRGSTLLLRVPGLLLR